MIRNFFNILTKFFRIDTRNRINRWLKKMGVKSYVINDDFTINVSIDVDLSNKNLRRMPRFIQFNKINGSFKCCENKLISLKGCPRIVTRSFSASHNKLTTLKNGPEFVGEAYFVNSNDLISLEGLPEKLQTFGCYHNFLETLDGIPSRINGDLYCYNNKLTDIKSLPSSVRGDLVISFSNFFETEFQVSEIRKICLVGGFVTIKDHIFG